MRRLDVERQDPILFSYRGGLVVLNGEISRTRTASSPGGPSTAARSRCNAPSPRGAPRGRRGRGLGGSPLRRTPVLSLPAPREELIAPPALSPRRGHDDFHGRGALEGELLHRVPFPRRAARALLMR